MRLNLVRLFVCACSSSGDCFCAGCVCSSVLGRFKGGILYRVVVAASGTTSGIRASRFGLGFLKIRRARDLIRWRSCVDLRSEVLVFVESCVDLRRTQGGLVESVVK